MSERYWVTGCQLGLLMSIPNKKDRQKVGNKVIDKQFIGNYPTDKDKEQFLKQIRKVR